LHHLSDETSSNAYSWRVCARDATLMTGGALE
jgi:hypothetical protein